LGKVLTVLIKENQGLRWLAMYDYGYQLILLMAMVFPEVLALYFHLQLIELVFA
jgi:hypothetical protein